MLCPQRGVFKNQDLEKLNLEASFEYHKAGDSHIYVEFNATHTSMMDGHSAILLIARKCQ